MMLQVHVRVKVRVAFASSGSVLASCLLVLAVGVPDALRSTPGVMMQAHVWVRVVVAVSVRMMLSGGSYAVACACHMDADGADCAHLRSSYRIR